MSAGLSVFAWFGSLAFYLLLAGQVSWAECAAGLSVATAIAVFAVVQHAGQRQRLQLRAPWRHVVFTPLGALLTDSARVGAVLARAVLRRPAGATGIVTRQPFRPGGEEPKEAGRRAIVTLGSSLAPNGFVLDLAPSMLPETKELLIMHRLAPVNASQDTEWPL